jgi:ABC-type transporter Mla subunit MlaD
MYIEETSLLTKVARFFHVVFGNRDLAQSQVESAKSSIDRFARAVENYKTETAQLQKASNNLEAALKDLTIK